MIKRELQTVEDVIEALDGASAVAKLTGKKSQHVWNWKSTNRFPAETFLILSEELKSRGRSAPPTLWGIVPVEQGVS